MNENNYPNIPVSQVETIIQKEEEERLLAGENSKVKEILSNFEFFGVLSILYGIFYSFCLYKNVYGITMPIFTAGTFAYFISCMRKLEIPLKRDAWFYVVSACLLGISNCRTCSSVLIFFNYVGIFLLLFGFLIHHFYEDLEWHFGKQLASMLSAFFGGIGCLHYLFKGFSYYKKKKENIQKKDDKSKYIWLGIIIAIPMLLVVCTLLMSADAVFRTILQSMLGNIVIPTNLIGIAITTLLVVLGSYGLIVWFSKKQLQEDCTDKKTLEPLIAITFTSLLTIIYLVFSAIQILYLFMGNMELPSGYTYASYAREGFFQLLFVCFINLGVVLVCVERFRDHSLLKVILTVFSACTYIMTASSAMRMIWYIKTYYLTFLRVLVLWTLAVLALLLTGILISIYRISFPLFRYCMIVVTLCYLFFSLAKPDYFIAKYNIRKAMGYYEEMKEDGTSFSYEDKYLDEKYLFYHLSFDAAPAMEEAGLFTQKEGLKVDSDKLQYYYNTVQYETENMGLRTFNFSRYRAKKIVEKYF
ncbi:MAG: DUF4173 domain-containing protein [Lachnospiraceae bacterium]|nr:DUF4173 domain-containing protein [Lachnospiraceae bacterium]